MSKTTTVAAELADSVAVTFPEAISINGTDTTNFILSREPTGEDLGRHTFGDLLEGNVRALAHVTPKIIQPYLSPKQIKEMGARNNMALTLGYNAFFEGVDMEGMAKPVEIVASVTKTTPSTASAQKAD